MILKVRLDLVGLKGRVFSQTLGNKSVPSFHIQHLSSTLARLSAENKLCHSFQTFLSSYSDTGLLGIHFVTDKHNIDDMMYLAQNSWSVMISGQRGVHRNTVEMRWIKMLIFCPLCWQDEPLHHSHREWCSQRQECSEGQSGQTAQWYVNVSILHLCKHKYTKLRNHKSTHFANLPGTTPTCDEIGRNILNYGRRVPLAEWDARIDVSWPSVNVLKVF